jgi:hypothetical protein
MFADAGECEDHCDILRNRKALHTLHFVRVDFGTAFRIVFCLELVTNAVERQL